MILSKCAYCIYTAKGVVDIILGLQNSRRPTEEGAMEKKTSTFARFMQPLIQGFLNSLSIPVSFLRHLKEEEKEGLEGHPLKKVVLMTEPHRHWDVVIEGGRHFKDGWQEFCLHHQLGVGDFLVFVHQGHFLFHVTVYDPATVCQRQFSPSSHRHFNLKSSKKGVLKFNSTPKGKPLNSQAVAATAATAAAATTAAATAAAAAAAEQPSCDIKLTSHCFKREFIYLPMPFSRSSGLLNRNCSMTLVDGDEKKWEVGLSFRKSDGLPYIVQGWQHFQAANNLEPGNILSFRLLKAGNRPILKCYRIKKQNSSIIHKG